MGRNMEHRREYMREWRANNRERLREHYRKFRRNHPERCRAKDHDYYMHHKEAARAQGKRWYWSHLETARQRSREQARKHRDKYRARMAAYNRRYAADHPEILSARWAVKDAIRRGDLFRSPCEVCGEDRVDAHHEDYSKPLKVRWLCKEHHATIHWQP